MAQIIAPIGMFLLFIEFAVFCQSLWSWNEPGHVAVPRSGPVLELQGAPGDAILLNLPVSADEEADYRELAVEFQVTTAASKPQLQSLQAKFSEADWADAVVGRLQVPALPEGTVAKGRLFGTVRFPGGKTQTLNTPLDLNVLSPGEGLPSGTRNMKEYRWGLVLLNLCLAGLGGALIAPLAASEIREERRRQRGQLMSFA